MLYMPMADEIPNYEWSASNCYQWTPWLDFVVGMIESANCVDMGMPIEVVTTETTTFSDATQKKRITDASVIQPDYPFMDG